MSKVSPFRHAPVDFDCPFCMIVRGEGSRNTTENEVVLRDERVTAFMASRNWPNNRGHVLVVPNDYSENNYELPDELGTPIQSVARRIALAMKQAYHCDGVPTRQHNEPSGNQDVWHYHMHVYPRYRDDMLYLTSGRATTAEERWPLAERLRASLARIETG